MTSTPAPPENGRSAAELVTMPEPARPSAKRARAALEPPPPPPEPNAAGAPPFTMDADETRPRRKGGHKRTKAELERRTAELERQLAAIAGEQDPATVGAVASLRPALGATFGAVFGMLASSRGRHWQLERAENDQLADAWAPVLAPYLSETADALPWLAAAGVTYQVVEKRITTDREHARGNLVVEPAEPEPAARPAPAEVRTWPEGMGGARPLDPPAYVPPVES